MSRFALLRRGAVVAVAVAAAAPALASAGTLRLVDDPASGGKVMEFEAAPGEINHYMTWSSANNAMGVMDDGFGISIPITPVPPCFSGSPDGAYTAPYHASCPSGELAGIRVLLGDQMDQAAPGPSFGQLTRMTVHGGPHDDSIGGGLKDDVLRGDEGTDQLNGSEGNDVLEGGAGPDTMEGELGDDTLLAADGEPDTVNCGEGTDTARADAVDTVVGCETVNGLTPGTPPPTLPAVDVTDPRPVATPPRRVDLDALVARGLKVKVGCGEPCSVRLRLEMGRAAARRIGLSSAARVVIGRGARELATAAPARVTVRLARKARRALRKVKRVRLVLRTAASDLAGNEAIVTRVLRARR